MHHHNIIIIMSEHLLLWECYRGLGGSGALRGMSALIKRVTITHLETRLSLTYCDRRFYEHAELSMCCG